MTKIASLDELKAIYGEPSATSVEKEIDHLIPEYEEFLRASPFCLLSTTGSGGLDCSPRGDKPGFVTVQNPQTLLMPDRRGNNRTDSLQNIIETGKVGLCFLVPGSTTCLRINGTAHLTTDDELLKSFSVNSKAPRSVIVIKTEAVYFQCGRAIIRAGLWDPENQEAANGLPTPGDIMTAITKGEFDGRTYDEKWNERAEETMW